MSKINQIENALLELEGGKFQKVCNAYLAAKGYAVNALGSVAGKDKSKIGTPDCFIASRQGAFTFVEYTTQQDGVCDKFKDDIAKCLDEGKTGILKKDIELIILFYNTRQCLFPEEQRELYEASQGIPIDVYSLSGLANDLYKDHKNIVRDELNIFLDTGQIFTLDDFIKEHNKNKSSTPLGNEFLYRDKELELLGDALQNTSLIFLSGSAGVGKTKLAIEALRQYQENNKCENLYIHCIKSYGASLYEDIKDHLSKDGEHIVLVDDANRIGASQYIFELTQNVSIAKSVKVIATVRDYALKSIIVKCSKVHSYSEIVVEAFQEEEISKILETSCGITNSEYTRKIWDISQGNPRIAIMAGRVAKETKSLSSLDNMEGIYDKYFSNIIEDLGDLIELKVLKVAGIISFFRSIDLENQEQMDSINQVFDISQSDFAEISFKLRDMEVVDAFDKVVKISDQVLSTYLFYLSVFKQEVLSFSNLLDNFALSQTNRLRDALYPCLNTFDGNKIVLEKIEPHVNELWRTLEEKEDHFNLEKMVNLFGFMRTTKVLLYLKNRIDKTEKVTQDYSEIDFEIGSSSEDDFILHILGRFAFIGLTIEDINLALGLLLDYTKKRPDLTSNILSILTKEYGLGRQSYRQYYQVQISLINILKMRVSDGSDVKYFSKILRVICFCFLKTEHDFTECRSSKTVTFGSVTLPFDDELIKLRESVWSGLLLISSTLMPYDLLKEYKDIRYNIGERAALEYDAKIIFKRYIPEMNSDDLRHIKMVREFVDVLKDHDVSFDEEFVKDYQSEDYDLLTLLTGNRRSMVRLGSEKAKKLQEQKIKSFLDVQLLEPMRELSQKLEKIDSVLRGDYDRWEYYEAINVFYNEIFERDHVKFLELIKIHFQENNFMSLDKSKAIEKLLDILSVEDVFDLLNCYKPTDVFLWRLLVFVKMPDNQCTPEYANQIVSLYTRHDMAEYSMQLDFLVKFKACKKTIIEDVVRAIVSHCDENEFPKFLFYSLFARDLTLLNDSFLDDFDFLKIVYFKCQDRRDIYVYHHPSDLKFMLGRNPSFILDCVDYVFEREERLPYSSDTSDYSFLWKEENYCNVMKEIFFHTYQLEPDNFYRPYIRVFFKDKSENSDVVQERQDTFIQGLIDEYCDNSSIMKYLFLIVEKFSNSRQILHIKYLLRLQPSFELFKALQLLPSGHSWSGSFIPILQKEIEFLEDVKLLCTSSAFLEHRAYLEDLIIYHRRRIKSEEKREFLDDF